jgi:type IV secretion system protein VirB5
MPTPASYQSPQDPLETPYQRARQVWDDRIGNARVQAFSWRLVALGNILVSLAAIGGILYQSSKAQVVPYIVEVDTQGQVRTVGPAQEVYRPSQEAVKAQLREFVRGIRGRSTDAVVVRERWVRAYAHATPKGQNRLNDYARQADPLSKIGKESVAVEVGRILALTDTTYDVQWQETTYDSRMLKTGDARWSGVFRVVVEPPTTTEQLEANPLGIYVDGWDWSRMDQ